VKTDNEMEALQDALAEYDDEQRFDMITVELGPDVALQASSLCYEEMLEVEFAYADTMDAHDRLPEGERRAAWGDDYGAALRRKSKRRDRNGTRYR